MLLFEPDATQEQSKPAQILLLKAAKLDSTQANPFALLGYWYELHNDQSRAIGCYSKALLLDPSHPVAGRGISRLKTPDSLSNLFRKATDGGSLNGWAWRSLGVREATIIGNDEFAVVSFLKALRCRDVDNPYSDPLAFFYADPSSPQKPGRNDFIAISSELAACYRRLGKYTSALRTFATAIDASGEEVASSLLYSCAQGKSIGADLTPTLPTTEAMKC